MRRLPSWVVIVTFLAAATRLAGAVCLAFRVSWALPSFSVSLFLVVVIMFRGFVLADVARVIRPSQIVLEFSSLAISIAAVLYAGELHRTGGLR